MNAARKYVFCFAALVVTSVIATSTSFATTEFILLTKNNSQRITCEYVEIENNHIKCSEGQITINFELSNVHSLEITDDGNKYQIQQFTTDNIKKINDIKSDKNKGQKETLNKKDEQSVDVFVKSIKRKFAQNIGNSTLSKIVQGSGFIIFLIGSFGYLVATFRTSIIWGLSCLFLPFVSLIFLFVHWKKASKPFFTSMTGIAIIFLGVLLTHSSGSTAQKIEPGASFPKTNNDGRFTCSGKIYCSEMTSCDEAKFYLRNCPGTKMDGNNDGIPCEKQWCGQ